MTDPILAQVLTVGPSPGARGGIASVIQTYKEQLPSFHSLPTNSVHGTAAGAFVLATTLLRMPLERLRGRRILHVHSASGKSFVRKAMLIRWGRLLGYKIIFHAHSGGFADYVNRVGIDRVRSVLARCDAAIVLSPQWKEYFEYSLGCSDVTVLPNMVVPPAHPVGARLRRADEPLRLLFLGKICRDKGVYDLLQALAHPSLRGRVQLTVGGNDEVEQFLAAAREAGLAEAVEYVGWVTGDKKDKLLEATDLLVLPSYVEAMPITVLEAMTYGRGVIASRAGALPSLVRDGLTGFLVDAGDVDALVHAIRRYMDDPSLAVTQGAAAREHIAPFLPQSVHRALTALYSRLLK